MVTILQMTRACLAIGVWAAAFGSSAQAQHVADNGATEVVVKGQRRQKPAESAPPPPLNLYAALPKYEQMALSPDGDHIAFLTSYDGNHYIVSYDLVTKTKRAVKLSEGKIASIAWADADHVLINAGRTGLRGTCGSAPADAARPISAAQNRNTADALVINLKDGAEAAALKNIALALLDSIKIPDCVYFGVRSQNAVTSVNMSTSTGVDLGAKLSTNPNLPLGMPELTMLDGKPQLVGPFLELRAETINRQPTERVYLWKVDAETGLGKMIDDGGGDIDRENAYVDDWLLDRDGRLLARTVYRFDTKRFAVEMRKGSGWRPVLTRTINHPTHTVSPYLAGPGRTDGTILIVDAAPGAADMPGPRTFHYYELSVDGKVSGPLETGDAAQDRPVFDPKSGHLAGFVENGEGDIYNLTDASLQSLYRHAQNVVPGETAIIYLTKQALPDTLRIKELSHVVRPHRKDLSRRRCRPRALGSAALAERCRVPSLRLPRRYGT